MAQLKAQFARVLNDLAPGKYVITNVDSAQMLRIEISANPEKPNFLVDGMFIMPYGHVEASLSPSVNGIGFYSIKIADNSMLVAHLNMLGGWTIAKVE